VACLNLGLGVLAWLNITDRYTVSAIRTTFLQNRITVCISTTRQRVLTAVHRQRHNVTYDWRMNFGCLNIRSLNNKLDDVGLIEISRDHCIDVLFLVETWHDADNRDRHHQGRAARP